MKRTRLRTTARDTSFRTGLTGCGTSARLLQRSLLLVLVLCGAASGADSIDYDRLIKPLFKQRCHACNGALKQRAHLRLDTGTSIRGGGDGGPAVVPGHSDESPLVERLAGADATLRMPPESSPLSPERMALMFRWIDQGATSPSTSLRPRGDPCESPL